ncbi:DNA primase [Cupriavidus metallidurans]|uniref:DNA primase n=1 Tax=Cupriavidus metallidurans TaxID=119219 RepID=UPI0016502F41|nr:DNA primase [Cupriavidus metallidurans]
MPKLERVYQSGPYTWRAACPAHGRGIKGSLSVRELDDGRLLLHCHAGCEILAVVTALCLELEDLFPPRTYPGFVNRREAFNASDVLRGIGPELLVAAASARALRNGEALDAAALERFDIAIERLAHAGGLANV